MEGNKQSCGEAIVGVLGGQWWLRDQALGCVRRFGEHPSEGQADSKVLLDLLSKTSPTKWNTAGHGNEIEAYLALAAAISQVPQLQGTSDLLRVCSLVLANLATWQPLHLSQISGAMTVFRCVEPEAGKPENVGTILNFLQAIVPLIAGTKYGEDSRPQWIEIAVACCNVMGDVRYMPAVAMFDSLLQDYSVDVDILVSAVENLGRIGSSEAVEAICAVLPRRVGLDSIAKRGYHVKEHDALSAKAAEAIVSIGTEFAFSRFIAKCEETRQRNPDDDAWLLDIDKVLSNLPDHKLTSFVRALLSTTASDELRSRMFRRLPRSVDTSSVLEEMLDRGLPGYKWGMLEREQLLEFLDMAGPNPKAGTVIVRPRQEPRHLDLVEAARYQAKFSSSYFATPTQSNVDQTNDLFDKVNRQSGKVKFPPITGDVYEGQYREVPLAYIEIDYPRRNLGSTLKSAILDRSTTGFNWLSIVSGLEGLSSDRVVLETGYVLLTSVRLIAYGVPEAEPGDTKLGSGKVARDPVIIAVFLRDLVDVRFESPVVHLELLDGFTGLRTILRFNIAYPGPSLGSVFAGTSWPNDSVSERLRTDQIRRDNEMLGAKARTAEEAFSSFLVDMLERYRDYNLGGWVVLS